MFVRAAHVVGERQRFDDDEFGVVPRGDELSRLLQMRRVVGVHAGAVLLANVRTLSVHAVRVDDLEEIRHQLRDAHDRRVEAGPHTFGIAVVLTVERLPGAVRSSSLGEEHPRQGRDEGLNAPQTAARQIDFFGLAHVPMLRRVVDVDAAALADAVHMVPNHADTGLHGATTSAVEVDRLRILLVDVDGSRAARALTTSAKATLSWVHSMDRLARSMRDLLQVVGDLTERGVNVQFVKEGIASTGDEADPCAVLMMQLWERWPSSSAR